MLDDSALHKLATDIDVDIDVEAWTTVFIIPLLIHGQTIYKNRPDKAVKLLQLPTEK